MHPLSITRLQCSKRRFLVLVAVGVNALLFLSLFGFFSLDTALDRRHFTHDSGHCYIYPVHLISFITPTDTMDFQKSELNLLEDNRLLGPGHAYHEGIRQVGEGRFSHWRALIYMSTSDNSDPRTNGRIYKITYPLKAPGYVVATSLLLTAVGFSFVGALPQDRKKLLRNYVFAGVAFAIGTLTAILPLEIFLRTDYSKQYVFGAFHQLPTRLQPKVNAKGYRDHDHEIRKRPGDVRILALGDSVTFGDGVADDEVYPRLLQQMAAPNVEIIALAKDGWGTADHLVAWRREGVAYHPDVVFVAAITNDPSPPTTEPRGQEPPWIVFRTLSPNLMLFRLLDFHLNLLAENFGWKYSYADWERDIYDPNKRYRVHWGNAVRSLSQEIHAEGITPYAFLLLGPSQIKDSESWKFQALYDVFSRAGFKTINLREPYIKTFQGIEPRSLFALPDDGHPGARVHQFFANEIWKVVKPEVEQVKLMRKN